MTPIAFARPSLGEDEAAAAAAAVASGWVTTGPRVQAFEAAFAATCQQREAVAVSSWTTGAFLVLHAWGIGPGDEILVPSLTFIASVNVIRHVGATPVFVDVVPGSINMDPADATRKVTPRTRVIMPVDQLGLPCDADAFKALAEHHGLRMLQDSACAIGSRWRNSPVGGRADAAVYSLHARKVVTTGEGGMIVTNDRALAERLRRLRHQGMSLSDLDRHSLAPTVFEHYPEIGFNFRLTDIQAAVGIVQLDRLAEMLARRRHVAERYNAILAHHPILRPLTVDRAAMPNWQSYQVWVHADRPTRNDVMDRLHAEGIPTRRGVMACHREAPYRDLPADLPETDVAADLCLQLPMHAGLSDEELDRIGRALAALA